MNKSRKKLQLREAPSRAEVRVPVGEVLIDVAAEFREILVKGGLAVAAALFSAEVEHLCGPRYGRGEELASRWGTSPGEAVLGGRKVRLPRPRVRGSEGEVALESYAQLQREDPLTERAVEQMLIGVSTRRYERSLEPVIPDLKEFGTSKSAVSRRFVARTQAQLEQALVRPLGGEQWPVLMIDGIRFHEHIVLLVLGVDETGAKQVLAFREGSTENATLCREMLADLVERGLPADRSLLIVMDGGKGLRRAVTEVFGARAEVQRCQVHKKRNVLEHLPDDRTAQIRAAMNQAYAADSHELALRQLKNLAAALKRTQPSAAASLLEGLEETLTVKALGITGALARTLQTTNAIENLNSGVRRVAGRVKRCRHGSMALRWVATAAFESARGFHRLRGHKDILKLIHALEAHDAELDGSCAASIRRTGS
jgi:transposase-like protein